MTNDFTVIAAASDVIEVVPRMDTSNRLAILPLARDTKVDDEPREVSS